MEDEQHPYKGHFLGEEGKIIVSGMDKDYMEKHYGDVIEVPSHIKNKSQLDEWVFRTNISWGIRRMLAFKEAERRRRLSSSKTVIDRHGRLCVVTQPVVLKKARKPSTRRAIKLVEGQTCLNAYFSKIN
jgi:hypothetical protein